MGKDDYDKLMSQNISGIFTDSLYVVATLRRYFRRHYKPYCDDGGLLERKLIEISPNIESGHLKEFLEIYKGYFNLFESDADQDSLDFDSALQKEDREFRMCDYLTAASNVFLNAKLNTQAQYVVDKLNPNRVYEHIENISNDIRQRIYDAQNQREENIHQHFVSLHHPKEEDLLN